MKFRKPPSCTGCPLHAQGQGFVRPEAGVHAQDILLCGEAPGEKEALQGRPFCGQAGAGLNRILHIGGWKRSQFHIHNIISCRPPWNRDPTWEEIEHCSTHLEAALASLRPKVVVAMGEIALRRFCGTGGIYDKRAPKRGYPYQSSIGSWSGWVVPTLHPAFILRGKANLIGTVIADIQRAERIARRGYNPPPLSCTLDPAPPLVMGDLASEILETVWPTTPNRKATDFLLTLDLETDSDGSISRFSLAWGSAMRGCTMPYNADTRAWLQHVIRADHGWKYLCIWNHNFDVPLLRAEGFEKLPPILDQMDLAHFYQSDIPMSLGFQASLLTELEEWKSLGASGGYGAYYSATDAVAQHMCMLRVLELCKTEGIRTSCFKRHAIDLIPVLDHMREKGIPVNMAKRKELRSLLEMELEKLQTDIEASVPDGVVPPEVRQILFEEIECPRCVGVGEEPDVIANRKVHGLYISAYARARPLVLYKKGIPCSQCKGDGAVRRQLRPAAAGEERDGWIAAEDAGTLSWQQPGQFLIKSTDHLKNYILAKHHQLPMFKGRVCLDADSVRRLAKRYKTDPVYPLILKGRMQKDMCDKFLAPAYDGIVDGDGVRRVHTTFTNVPSTWRLSSRDPNLQNVPKRGAFGKAARACFEAEMGCVLVEADLSAAEAVMVGYFADDPDYIRASKLSIHAILASHILGSPIDLGAPDAAVHALVKQIKREHKKVYARAKRVIHGTAYGMTPFLMTQLYPEEFPNIKVATNIQKLYFSVLARKVRLWQWKVLLEARQQGYLESPWGQRHYFWDALRVSGTGVLHQEAFLNSGACTEGSTKVTWGGLTFEWGDQAKDALAFYPQNGTSSWVRECMHELWYGDADWVGRRLRLQVHDALVFNVEHSRSSALVHAVRQCMQRPIPEMGGLELGTEIKMGPNWSDMKEV